jgi:hypothetical protein
MMKDNAVSRETQAIKSLFSKWREDCCGIVVSPKLALNAGEFYKLPHRRKQYAELPRPYLGPL